jgi:hypothetical protein
MNARSTMQLIVFAGAIAVASCGSFGSDKSDKGTGETSKTSAAVVGTALNTFINASLEIDQAGTSFGPDANLFVGNDPPPGDGSASYQKPTGGPSNWIDWNDLGGDLANHRILDLDGPGGKDSSSFPQSNECVGASQVLSKMDLTYVAAANNNTYAYFAVQRSDNNGDAGYYWLFTKKAPHQILAQAPCGDAQTRLLYDISGPGDAGGGLGDVLLAGHFKPNTGAPLLSVYRATRDENGVPAGAAIDFTSSLWAPVANGVAAVAVNTTEAAPGLFGSAGVKGLAGGAMLPEIFAEAAVPLSVFTSGSSCGASYFGSVITRPSGSGGPNPDLKDLAGPAQFNFGNITASATLTGSCAGTLGYNATATGAQGTTTCTWSFKKDGSTVSLPATGCSGTLTGVAPGSYEATVVVSDSSGALCQDDATSAPATVQSPITVNITPSATSLVCSAEAGAFTDAVTYTANPGGGTGTFTYAWTGTTCTEGSQTGATCTINPADNDFCPVVKIKVTVSSGTCAATPSEEETYTKQTSVTASNDPPL